MNPVQMLDAVETCIKERPALSARHWLICWHEGRLKCLPVGTIKDDGNVFGTFNVDDLNQGLTLDQWSQISRKITLFFERKK